MARSPFAQLTMLVPVPGCNSLPGVAGTYHKNPTAGGASLPAGAAPVQIGCTARA